jgi:hypothetical protein
MPAGSGTPSGGRTSRVSQSARLGLAVRLRVPNRGIPCARFGSARDSATNVHGELSLSRCDLRPYGDLCSRSGLCCHWDCRWLDSHRCWCYGHLRVARPSTRDPRPSASSRRSQATPAARPDSAEAALLGRLGHRLGDVRSASPISDAVAPEPNRLERQRLPIRPGIERSPQPRTTLLSSGAPRRPRPLDDLNRCRASLGSRPVPAA